MYKKEKVLNMIYISVVNNTMDYVLYNHTTLIYLQF